jgi:hypothetical protein
MAHFHPTDEDLSVGTPESRFSRDPIKFGNFNKRRHENVPEQSNPHRISR